MIPQKKFQPITSVTLVNENVTESDDDVAILTLIACLNTSSDDKEKEHRQVAFCDGHKKARARNVANVSDATAVEPEAEEERPRDTAVRRHNDAGAGIGVEDPTDAGEGGDEERRPLGIPRDELRRRVRGHVRDFRGELREVDAHKQFEQHRRHHNFPAQRGTNRAPSANHDQRLRKHLAHKNARVRAENYNGN